MGIKKYNDEQATGIVENPHGLGTFYTGRWNDNGHVQPGDDELTPQEACGWLLEGHPVAVPNAGAGSYAEFFEACGFTEVEVFQNGSSAGDWTFCVRDGPEGAYYAAFQENRYPRHGFEYSVNFDMPFESFAQMCEFNA